jgi:hypothetical protein
MIPAEPLFSESSFAFTATCSAKNVFHSTNACTAWVSILPEPLFSIIHSLHFQTMLANIGPPENITLATRKKLDLAF